MKFHIYDNKTDKYLKMNCDLQAVIPPGHVLTDDEVRQYFGIDEGHKHWDRAHRPASKVRRLVFDKCIIPDTPRFRCEPVYEEDD